MEPAPREETVLPPFVGGISPDWGTFVVGISQDHKTFAVGLFSDWEIFCDGMHPYQGICGVGMSPD